MKSYKLAVLYGFLILLIPSILLFPISILLNAVVGNDSILLDSILTNSVKPVILVICGVLFSSLYFKKLESDFVKEGMILGTIWFAMSAAVPILLFRAILELMLREALIFLIYPAITVGFGCFLKTREGMGVVPPSDRVWQHYQQALAYREQDDFQKALEECNTVIQITPNSADAHNLRGVILEELGRTREAILAYDEALRLDPNLDEAKENLQDAQAELEEGGA